VLLDEAARLAGMHRWVELRLFEVFGSWVASTDDLDAKLLFDRHSQHHAWRAQQWWDRLPVLADVDRDALVVAPTPAAAASAAGLAAVEGTVPRLAGAYRVALPRLAAAYHDYRSKASPVSDGAAIRLLGLLQPDVASDWREGEVLLQHRLVDAAAVVAAASVVARFEQMIVSSSPARLLT
jgi:hypothetical protein